jgi:hypothetical protein
MKSSPKKGLGAFLWGTSAVSTIIAVCALIPIANAQNAVPDGSQPVSVSTPSDRNVMTEIHFDPFLDTVDQAGRLAALGQGLVPGGAALGTPDVPYGSVVPVDGSVLRGGVAGRPRYNLRLRAAPASAASDPLRGVLFVGWVSGKPPLAIVRQADGKEGVFAVGDVVVGQTVTGITASTLTFANRRILALTPIPVPGSTAGIPPVGGALASPLSQLLPGAPVGTAPGAGPLQLTPALTNITGGGTGALTAPVGGPDSENVGRMPLSPTVPGGFGLQPATPSPGGVVK